MSDRPRENAKRVFPPPDELVECTCLHCGRIYTSDMMLEVEIEGEFHYACPVSGCTAMGWNFDIFPTADFEDEDESFDDDLDEEADDDDDLDLVDNDATDVFEFTPGDDLSDPVLEFEPPREWTPEADHQDPEFDDPFGLSASDADDPLRGTIFTREEYDALKSSGELDRKADEIRREWADRKDDSKRPASDEDLLF